MAPTSRLMNRFSAPVDLIARPIRNDRSPSRGGTDAPRRTGRCHHWCRNRRRCAGTLLAGAGFEVALLEREISYPDRVRGEFIVPWGVTELAKLELLQPLREAGALFTGRNIPYDENFAPAEAEARALDLTKMHQKDLAGSASATRRPAISSRNWRRRQAPRCSAAPVTYR